MLDIDFGIFPFVTSFNLCVGGFCTGLGMTPSRLGDVVGVAKAYTTHVGSGPYPTVLFGVEREELRKAGFEWGITTEGLVAVAGWIIALNFACTIIRFTAINLTKLDVLSGLVEIKLSVAYRTPSDENLRSFSSDLSILEQFEVEYETLEGWKEDNVSSYYELPAAAQRCVEWLEGLIGLPC